MKHGYERASVTVEHRRTSAAWRWLQEHWIGIAILVSGLVFMNLIFIAKAFRTSGTVDPAAAGQLGDFVGGYIGTFFVLISVVLLWTTLRYQVRSAQVLNFEAKYFELLRLHRDNVEEMKVQGVVGRRLFVMLLREFRAALEITKRVASQYQQQLSQEQAAHICYYCVFYGTGPNSSRMLVKALAEFDRPFIEALDTELDSARTKNAAQSEQNLAYVPFEGHQSRLGHYYRHLYQAIRYVDQQTIKLDKYEYAKTIRAQLSNHEQAILLLNSLTPIGSNWWKRGFMLNYRMVQNIPRDFFDPVDELNMSALFPANYFEWEEVERAP